jgi:hypothetical protein
MLYPIIKLPQESETALFLIREELKSRKFFHALQQAGLDDSCYQPHLDDLILRNLALNDDSDEVLYAYDKIMERRSRKIQPDNNSVMKQALKAYHELLVEKKKLATEKKRVSG